ncbi:hypothetical protein O181_101862 [Austropuccinia psidii MF-1]|uniref:Uncharacterized protein n=1 Tax=Austropuccinia psidii MF-1 TaxID=1389203 RepID=A0A9Q3PIY2_9BASI|nr:hypothetical protein [Austropuccinia psidii MF-1]
MNDGDGKRTFQLGPIVTMSCNPWDSNAKTHPFNVCLASKPCGNPLLARVAPDGQRTYSMNPPSTMSHLFLARVHPPNHLRTFRLMSQNQRWQQHNPWRNHLVSPNFYSPLLFPSPACPTTPCLAIIIDNMPFGSPTPVPHPSHCRQEPNHLLPQCQAPLIPTMTLARNSPT